MNEYAIKCPINSACVINLIFDNEFQVLAHELGHNFGMQHDFHVSHGGHNGPCDGQGIMSYGSYDYKTWSTCSRSDWERHYSSENWGETCLEDISGV